jgi:hypothetical protein
VFDGHEMAGSRVADLAASTLPGMFREHYDKYHEQTEEDDGALTNASGFKRSSSGKNVKKALPPLSEELAATMLSSVFANFQQLQDEAYEIKHLKLVREEKAKAEKESGLSMDMMYPQGKMICVFPLFS